MALLVACLLPNHVYSMLYNFAGYSWFRRINMMMIMMICKLLDYYYEEAFVHPVDQVARLSIIGGEDLKSTVANVMSAVVETHIAKGRVKSTSKRWLLSGCVWHKIVTVSEKSVKSRNEHCGHLLAVIVSHNPLTV